MAKYRAIRDSYGFRGRYWATGDIAEDVTESEKIPEHFEPVKPGKDPEKPRDESHELPEPTTLSEWQALEFKAKKTGKEFMLEPPAKPAPRKKARGE